MRLSNNAWAPVYSDLQGITMCCRENPPGPPCDMTTALEELRPATPPQDAHHSALNSLACVCEWLGSLLSLLKA